MPARAQINARTKTRTFKTQIARTNLRSPTHAVAVRCGTPIPYWRKIRVELLGQAYQQSGHQGLSSRNARQSWVMTFDTKTLNLFAQEYPEPVVLNMCKLCDTLMPLHPACTRSVCVLEYLWFVCCIAVKLYFFADLPSLYCTITSLPRSQQHRAIDMPDLKPAHSVHQASGNASKPGSSKKKQEKKKADKGKAGNK